MNQQPISTANETIGLGTAVAGPSASGVPATGIATSGAPATAAPLPSTAPPSVPTYWNGERTPARQVVVVVADNPDVPDYWARAFVGQQRNAVEVNYGGQLFYLDDEGYDRDPKQIEAMRESAQSLSDSMSGRLSFDQALQTLGGDRTHIGYPGWGWEKVTSERGSPAFGHGELAIESVVGPR